MSRLRALLATLPLAATLGAPSALASTATPTFVHGGLTQARFSTLPSCQSALTSAVAGAKRSSATNVSYGLCHQVTTPGANGQYSYDLTYQRASALWSSDTSLGVNPSASAGQHSFVWASDHATSLAAAKFQIASAQFSIRHTLGASVSWSSGPIKNAKGTWSWEVDANSRYASSTDQQEASTSPGATNVMLLSKTAGTGVPTTTAVNNGVSAPGSAASGWTAGSTKGTSPATPSAPNTTVTSGSTTTKVSTNPSTGTVTTTTTTPTTTTTEKVGVAGMDVSAHTVMSSYAQWKASGMQFLIAKANEGTYYNNPKHDAQIAGGRAAGMIVGSYDFANPQSSNAVAEADYFVAHGGSWKPNTNTLPGSLDIEYNPYGASCYGLSKSAMSAWINAYSTEYHAKTGTYPIVYSTRDWLDSCVGTGLTGTHDLLWLAYYQPTPGTIPSAWNYQTIWQNGALTSQGYDTDVFNGTLSSLKLIANAGAQ